MTIRILSFILVMTFGVKAQAQSKVTNINVKASIYCDHCKRCESCGKRLEEAVYKEKGIKRVEIDEATQTVKVTYNAAKTSPEKIRLAIAKVGFDADDVKGNAEAYASWDECCKKPQ